MKKAIEKAKILMQAMPYIKEYRGKKVLIKFGGKAMQDPLIEQSIANDLVMLRYVGLYPIVVHGGGPEISLAMEKEGLVPKFIDGLRVTDEQVIKIAKRVLVDDINKEIVENINSHGDLAVGLAGDDSGLIEAEKKQHNGSDLGFVGNVSKMNTEIIDKIVATGKIPVIATLGKGKDNQTYNINADSVACSLAAELGCEKIIYLTNVAGIYKDFKEKESLISAMTLSDCENLINENIVVGGMLPKVISCMKAINNGVHSAHILNGTMEHALLLEIFTDEGIGTMITNVNVTENVDVNISEVN